MRLHRWLVVPSLALLAACASTWPVDSYLAPDANLASRSTFYWAGGELGTVAAVDPKLAALTDSHVRDAVIAGLVRRGYTQVTDPKAADMQVRYQIVGTRRIETSERPRFGAPLPDSVLMQSNIPPPAASELPRERTIRDGTILVFAEAPGSGQLLWRGEVTSETRVGSNASSANTAAQMVRSIMEQFPARTAPH